MTTSAHPFPAFTFRLPPSSGLFTPVSRGFIFLPCTFQFLSSSLCTLTDTQLSDLPFSPPSVPPPSGFPNAPHSPLGSCRSSPFTLSGFPYSPSGSAYSACCLFPFILICFTPTAVPQIEVSPTLRLLRFLSTCAHAARFLSSTSGLEPQLLSLCFFLSLHPGFPSQSVLRCPSFRRT